MSNMLGRTGPWEQHCCTRHSGRYRMTGKRANEDRQWRKEVDEELAHVSQSAEDAR